MDLISFLWAAGNVLLLIVFAACIVFAIAYPLLFDPRTTTAGKAIWGLGLSLAGLSTIVVIGIFVDSPRDWWVPAEGTDYWRVIARLAIYGLVAAAMVNLDIVIFLRKFKPHRLRTAPPGEDTMDIRPRRPGKDLRA